MNAFVFAQNRFIFVFAGLMFAAVAAYWGFLLADRYFLSESEGTATVTGKEYQPFTEKYQVQNIGGRNQTVKIAVPETWLLEFETAGIRGKAQVERELFEASPEGTAMRIRFKKRRITGNLQVTKVLGRAEG